MLTRAEHLIKKRPRNSYKILSVISALAMNSQMKHSMRSLLPSTKITQEPLRRTKWSFSLSNCLAETEPIWNTNQPLDLMTIKNKNKCMKFWEASDGKPKMVDSGYQHIVFRWSIDDWLWQLLMHGSFSLAKSIIVTRCFKPWDGPKRPPGGPKRRPEAPKRPPIGARKATSLRDY